MKPKSQNKKTIIVAATVSKVFLPLMLLLSCLPTMSQRSYPRFSQRLLKRVHRPHATGIDLMVSDLTWSPDGRHAFYTIEEKKNQEYGDTRISLCAIRRNGSHIRRLYDWEHPGNDHPDAIQWSPDGSRIIMYILIFDPASSVNADGVGLLDIDPETGKRRKLSRALDGKPDTGFILERPGYYAFSPKGRYLLLTLGGNRQEVTNKRLVRITYATGKRKLLNSGTMASFDARWSSDGRRIAYIALPDSGGVSSPESYEQQVKNQHLYIMTADGRQTQCLTHDKGYFEEAPCWSADGKTILFVRRKLTNDQPRSLWTVRPNGTTLTRIRSLPPKED